MLSKDRLPITEPEVVGADDNLDGQMSTDDNDEFDEDKCFQCKALYASYDGPDWIRCIECYYWYCGHCN